MLISGFFLVGGNFVPLFLSPLWIFGGVLAECCLFYSPAWLVCSKMPADVEGLGKGRSGEEDLKAPQEAWTGQRKRYCWCSVAAAVHGTVLRIGVG